MNPNTRENLQSRAVSEVMELVKNYIDRKAEKKRRLNSPYVRKYGLFFEIDYGEVYGIVIRGNYSLGNEVVRNSLAHDVAREVWQYIPDYANKQGFRVKQSGNQGYVLYDRGGNFW